MPEVRKGENIINNKPERKRNYKRGIRSEATTNRTTNTHFTKQSGERRGYRKQRRPRGETGEGWPPKPDNLQSNPQKRLLKTRGKMSSKQAPQKTTHTHTRELT